MRRFPLKIFILTAIIYSLLVLAAPDGRWDAWSIWNLRAKFLFYGSSNAFHPALQNYAHLDYPPLLPVLVAIGWRIGGEPHFIVPALLQGIILFCILFSFLDRPLWAFYLVIAVCLPYAAQQMADLPLSLCFLVASITYEKKKVLYTGVALGLGVLIKNEGLLVALAFSVAILYRDRKFIYEFLVGFLPYIIIIFVYKSFIAIPNDVLGSNIELLFERLFDINRYIIMIPSLVIESLRFSMGVWIITFFCLYSQQIPLRGNVPIYAVCIILLGYIAIYAITPHDIYWHITSSWDRLLLHIYPACLYMFTRRDIHDGLQDIKV